MIDNSLTRKVVAEKYGFSDREPTLLEKTAIELFGNCRFKCEQSTKIGEDSTFFYTIFTDDFHLYIDEYKEIITDSDSNVIANIYFSEAGKEVVGIGNETMSGLLFEIKRIINSAGYGR